MIQHLKQCSDSQPRQVVGWKLWLQPSLLSATAMEWSYTGKNYGSVHRDSIVSCRVQSRLLPVLVHLHTELFMFLPFFSTFDCNTNSSFQRWFAVPGHGVMVLLGRCHGPHFFLIFDQVHSSPCFLEQSTVMNHWVQVKNRFRAL